MTSSEVEIELPPWSIAGAKRRAHIARVTALAVQWADAMRVSRNERSAWHDAAQWHDALRDASDAQLRAIVPHLDWPTSVLHGPAAALKLAEDGERRTVVIDAVYWHTVGNAGWDRTGKVLYMADYLEPGRQFEVKRRAKIAALVPQDFEGAFRAVVMMRLEAKVMAGEVLRKATFGLWESVQ